LRLTTFLRSQWIAHVHLEDVDKPSWLHTICHCVTQYAKENGLHGSTEDVMAAYTERMALCFTMDARHALEGDAVMQAVAARYYDINLVICTPTATVQGVHVSYGEVVRYDGDASARSRPVYYLGWKQ
jgi:hypothetical protein